MPWQVLEHTADVGLRATGEGLEHAIAELVVGFGRLLCPEGPIEAREERTVEVEAGTIEDLVVDLLDEVNFVHQTEGFLPGAAAVELDLGDGRLVAHLGGETYDRDKHGHLMEVKATTYHELAVANDPPRIEVIFDI